MPAFLFKHVHIQAYTAIIPPDRVSTSELEDQMAETYHRLGLPKGVIETLSGIKTRHFFDISVNPSDVATEAGHLALEQLPFPRDKIGAVLNCSVTRDYFEPATACLVHSNLGLSKEALVMDISNACIGVMDGMLLLGNLIDSGVIEAGLLISGETVSRVVMNTLKAIIQNRKLTRQELLSFIPAFTLGDGAVAIVLCHERLATTSHKLIGALTQIDSKSHDFCKGSEDVCIRSGVQGALMQTEPAKLIKKALDIFIANYPKFIKLVEWEDSQIDHIIAHQVGKKGNRCKEFYSQRNIDPLKEYIIYEKFGNMVSCALPTSLVLADREKKLKSGDKIMLVAFGSGINCIEAGIIW